MSCYILGTLQALFNIQQVNQFLKMIGRIDKEDCAINLRYKMFISVWRLKTHNSNKKIMKTHYWYRSRFEENFSKFFRNFKGNFFGQNFFFTFSTFQVKIHTLTKKNRKKKFFFFDVRQNWRQTKIDVWYLKLMAQSSLSIPPIVFKNRFTLTMLRV